PLNAPPYAAKFCKLKYFPYICGLVSMVFLIQDTFFNATHFLKQAIFLVGYNATAILRGSSNAERLL
ncbi:MAG: hypothetical protein LBB79_08015, partial [Prevotellaceae bacterium]|nr:hypothetical protein [Prevotellaceae bacterium]